MKNVNTTFAVVAALAAAMFLVMAPGPASADPINTTAGFDVFTTQRTSASSYNFASDPIPAGFFDPGSEPFDGVVLLGGEGGGADTIVQRRTDVLLGDPPSVGTVPIELVQLNLVSCNPITVTYGAGPDQLWDVHVVLSNAPPSTGGMTINKTHANGGTFTSNLVVQPVFTFTRVDIPLVTTAPLLRPGALTGTGSWSHTAPPDVLPSTNNFYPGGRPDDPQALDSVFYGGGGLNLELRLTQVPEPSALVLLAAGLAGLLAYVWRRRRR